MKKIHGRYFADGFLLEAASALAGAGEGSPEGRLLYDGDRVVLFAALAAEAHVNHAIETGLTGAAQEAAQRLRIKEKLRLVPGLAGAAVDLDPGREPLQGLYELVKQRNRLVHAQPDVWEIESKQDSAAVIRFPPNVFGTPLEDAASWLLSLCRYLDDLAGSDVAAWHDHAYLARELLTRQSALQAWEPRRDGPDLRSLVEYLTDADFEDEP